MSEFFPDLPPLIYGTAWKKEKTSELVEKAVLRGFRGIDTACQPKHYHEEGVGEALRRLKNYGIPRKTLFIQTKFTPLSGQDPLRIPYNSQSPIADQVRQSLSTSLINLGVDYLDALLLHSPLPRHEQTMEAWQVLEEMHKKGILHRIGISNCYEISSFDLIFQDATIKPSLLQNRFYAQTNYDKALRKRCIENKISYQSFWTLTANPNILSHPVIQSFALTRQVSVEQVFFRFLTQQQVIPLIGTCSENHMEQDLAIFKFALTDNEISQIKSLL